MELAPSGIAPPRRPARRRKGRIALGVTAQEVHRPGLDDAEPTIRRDGGRTESVQPTGERRHPSPLDRLEVVPAHDVGREVGIAGLDRVANGAVRIAGAVVPIGGTPVQDGQATWLPPRELQLEQVRQQRVVAVYLAPIVERGDEHVGPFERGQPLRRPGLLGQRVGERARDRVDDGRREHELERVRLEGRQDLLGEIVEDVAVRTAERGDELFPVLGGPHRQVGEIQPAGHPSVRSWSVLTLSAPSPRSSDVFTSTAVSSGVNCRSGARNSDSCSAARSRAIGSGGSVRDEMASSMPGGARSIMRMTVSWHSSASIRW